MYPDSTVSDVHAKLECAPSISAVRTMLKRLVNKNLVTETRIRECISFRVRLDKSDMVADALHRITEVFFRGSPVALIGALLELYAPLEDEQLAKVADLLRQFGNSERCQ
jgi:predicted transcriptional regulator